MALRLLPVGLSPFLPRLARPSVLPSRSFTSRYTHFHSSPATSLIKRTHALRPPQTVSVASILAKRPFSTSRLSALRQTYFPQGSNGGRGGGPRSSWIRRIRNYIDGYPPMYVIYALIGLNVGVYLLWQYAWQSWTRFRDPSLYQFMQKNFVLSEANVLSGRIWTLITSAFSHSKGDHILVNALGLYFIAPAAAGVIGSSAFLALYLGGGIVSSLTSLVWHRFKGNKISGSEGASGAIYTTLGFYGALFPRSTILMFFIIPMPVWVAIGGIFAWDLFTAVARPYSTTDAPGHIGGMLAGLVAASRLKRGGFGGIGRMFRR